MNPYPLLGRGQRQRGEPSGERQEGLRADPPLLPRPQGGERIYLMILIINYDQLSQLNTAQRPRHQVRRRALRLHRGRPQRGAQRRQEEPRALL